MKRTFMLCWLGLIVAMASVRAAEPTTNKTQADLDWDEIKRVESTEYPSLSRETPPRERARATQEYAVRTHTLMMAFIEHYPEDPRRWDLVARLSPYYPRFIVRWGEFDEKGEVLDYDIDQVAADAWERRILALRAAMARVTNLPKNAQAQLAAREQSRKKWESYCAKWIGQVAPDFTTIDGQGREVKLSDFRGRIVILDFWNTFCGPCKRSFPHLQALATKHKAEGVVVVTSCTLDKKENFEKWVREMAPKYPDIVWTHDPADMSDDRAAKRIYGVEGVPMTFILDREGRITAITFGYSPGEVMVDAALATAGVKIDQAILDKAVIDAKRRDYW